MAERVKLQMPRLLRVRLSDFSLYTQRRTITTDFGNGVFCLAGANGLGKSTFLAALGFGLTGVVPPDNPKFNSLAQYYARCLAYSRNYFDGRVAERDRESAEIYLEFGVGGRQYKVARNAFEPQALRYLEVSQNGEIELPFDESQSHEQRHEIYRNSVTSDVGLSTFNQLVFLQHHLLTFDERRKTLFWEPGIAEKVLYLALGLDPEAAERADELTRKADGEDSLARNAQYDATTARNRFDDLKLAATQQKLEQGVDDRQDDALTAAEERYAESAQKLDDLSTELADARLLMASASAREIQAQEAYHRQFELQLAPVAAPAKHPLILELLESRHCPICATSGESVIENVQAKLRANICPLCASSVLEDYSEEKFKARATALQQADRELGEAREELEQARNRVARLERDCEEARREVVDTRRYLADLEQRVDRGRTPSRERMQLGVEALERQFNMMIDDALSRKEQHIKKRDAALSALRPLRRQLLQAFSQAEVELVPLFQELATQFLGLPLSVEIQPVGSARVRLRLTVKNQRRRYSTQLSESQRYFLDIALRMALLIHMSGVNSPAPLYIDTPEGSLDIAYESRAGAMFAAFAKNGHPLIMTANINTSQLLLRLAEECGTSLMQIIRMTDWTSLSDVQAAEQQRIEDAYKAIELALRSAAPTGEVLNWVQRAHG